MWDRYILGYNFGEIPVLGVLKKRHQRYLPVETVNKDKKIDTSFYEGGVHPPRGFFISLPIPNVSLE